MEPHTGNPDTIIEEVRDYLEARQELIKLQVTAKASRLLSVTIGMLIICFIFLLAFLFFSIMLAHLFTAWIGAEYAGYLVVTSIYIVSGILLSRNKKAWLYNPIMNSIIKQLSSK